MLFVIPNPDIIARRAERTPRNVEPAVAGQELVGVFTRTEEVDKVQGLLRVFGADVSGLAQ